MILRHHQRNILRHAVVSPDLENVLHQCRFSVESLPRDIARFERIVLKRYEAEVSEPTGKYVGKAQILASQKVWQTAFPDAKGDVTNQIAEGEQVLTEAIFRGTHTGPLAGPNGTTIPATNKKIEMRIAFVDSFKDGKIQRERAYYDLAGMMQQLGLGQNGK